MFVFSRTRISPKELVYIMFIMHGNKQINRNLKASQIPSLDQHGNHPPWCSGHSFMCCQAGRADVDFSCLFHGHKTTVTEDNLSMVEVSTHCCLTK